MLVDFFLFGLWPYQQSKLVQFQLMLLFGISLSFIVSQFAVLVSAKCTIDIAIKVLSVASLFIIYPIQYNSFRINNEIVKRLFEELQHICDELEDENEIAIIKKYGNEAKRLTGIIIFALIGGAVTTATGMMVFGYLKHACGMFKIASYRIEKALMTNIVKKVSLNDEIIMYKEMILAVDIHRKATKFSKGLVDNFQKSMFFLITACVICLSLNFYGISTTFGDHIEDCIIHLLTVVVIFATIFLANYIGQEITDHNDHVFSTAYNVRWYMAPLHIQKLILFLLQRGSKTVNIRLGGILILSLECFATLTKASVSYFTFVYSTQE
ncbi:uncharacterized protein [Temnothorax longispinosus]|uniref:uncharacterized protein isoform X5 n=1 Tax=Temnothorax longispinosus TaxID=300112 RepID=UPI003A99659C